MIILSFCWGYLNDWHERVTLSQGVILILTVSVFVLGCLKEFIMDSLLDLALYQRIPVFCKKRVIVLVHFLYEGICALHNPSSDILVSVHQLLANVTVEHTSNHSSTLFFSCLLINPPVDPHLMMVKHSCRFHALLN